MSDSPIIEHKGTVVESKGGVVKVKIQVLSACAHCQVKGFCQVANVDEKIIDGVDSKNSFTAGDLVNVTLMPSLGFQAVFLAYLLPFILLITTLFSAWAFTRNEVLSGIAAIVALAPYYWILFLNKDKLEQRFNFHIKKIET